MCKKDFFGYLKYFYIICINNNMIRLSEYLYEAELNLEWWNSKSPAYQKRYLSKHPNSIYAHFPNSSACIQCFLQRDV